MFDTESIHIAVGQSTSVGFASTVGSPVVENPMAGAIYSVSVDTVVDKKGAAEVTCLAPGPGTIFGGSVADRACASLTIECIRRSMTWDTESEAVEPGSQGVAGIEIAAIDGEDANVIVTVVDPPGPVELVRADVGVSMRNQSFTKDELFYTYTQPEGLHLIVFNCADRGVQDVRARAVFNSSGNGVGIEVVNEFDLEVQCLPEGSSGTGGSSGSGGAGGTGGGGPTWSANVYVFDGQSYFDRQFSLVGSTLPPCGARYFDSAAFVYPDGQDHVSVIPDRVFSFENPSVPLFNPDPGGCEFGKEVDVLPTFTQVPVDLATLLAFCDTYRAAFLPPQVDPADVNPGQAVFTTCRNQVEFLTDFEQTWPMD
jgi:hypothetical protein